MALAPDQFRALVGGFEAQLAAYDRASDNHARQAAGDAAEAVAQQALRDVQHSLRPGQTSDQATSVR